MLQQIGKKRFWCKFCKRKFTTWTALIFHMRSHSTVKQHKGDVCGHEAKYLSTIKKHRRLHFQNNVTNITKSIRDEVDAIEEEKIDQTYLGVIDRGTTSTQTCPFCHKDILFADIKHHFSYHRTEKLACLICYKTFKQFIHLKNHMYTHSKEKPYKCQLCAASFIKSAYLEAHMCNHTGERQFSCKLCNKKFATLRYMTLHMKRHSSDRPYKCDICGRAAKERSTIKKHRRSHFDSNEMDDLKPIKQKADTCTIEKEKIDKIVLSDTNHETVDNDSVTSSKQTCPFCQKEILSKQLRHHFSSHRTETLKCSFCSKTFQQFGNLRRHMYTHTKDKPFKCQLCAESFIRSSGLKAHMCNHTGKKQFACKLCNKKFATLSYMTLHMKRHSSDRPYKCDICGRAAKERSTIKKHRRSHFDSNEMDDLKPIKQKSDTCTIEKEKIDKIVPSDAKRDTTDNDSLTSSKQTCPICQKDILSKKLRHHLISHRTETLKCSFCNKTFQQFGNLRRHLFIHTKEKPFKCQLCAKSFIRSSSLKTHMCNHAGEKQFVCKLCDKKFATLSYMTLHMKRHSSEKPYKCDTCGRDAKDPSTIKKHRCLHFKNNVIDDHLPIKHNSDTSIIEKEKIDKIDPSDTYRETFDNDSLTSSKQTCPFCQKDILSIKLRHHLSSHRTETLKCSFCNKTFQQFGNLRRHMFTHSKEKPFKCQLCAESFIRSSCLKAHMCNHTGEKQFACKLCDKKFATLSYMTLHMKRHSSDKPYKCDVCGRAAKDPSTIKKHRCLQIQSNVADDINPIKDKIMTSVKQETETFIENTDSDNTESNTETSSNQLHQVSHEGILPTDITSHLRSHGTEKLTCSLSNKTSEQFSNLKKHMSTHTKEKPYKCQICAESFTQSACLKAHKCKQTKEKQFVCDLCNKKFATLICMLLHVKIHGSDKPYKCESCDHVAKDQSALEKHKCLQIQSIVTKDINQIKDKISAIVNQEIETFIENPDSDNTENNTVTLSNQLHPVSHEDILPSDVNSHFKPHGTEKLTCSLCHETFEQFSNLKRHMSTHTKEKPYKCQFCAESFIQSSCLKAHMCKHTKEKQFLCSLCNKKFTTLICLLLHMKIHGSDKPYKCDSCDLAAKDQFALKKHKCLQIQSNVTEDINPIKDKISAIVKQKTETFIENTDSDNTESNIETLSNQQHPVSHEGTGILPTDFKSHVRSRRTEKLTCLLCQKRFRLFCTLKRHMYTHAKEKPYKCQLCPKSFIRSSCLKAHMCNHTGEKLFVCKLCNKKFATLNYMTLHMKRHSSEKPYKCDICGRAAKDPSTIKKHRCLQIQSNVTVDINPIKDKIFATVKQETETFVENTYSDNTENNTLTLPNQVHPDSHKDTLQTNISSHLSSHGAEKLTCSLCCKKFGHLRTLNRHMYTHAKEKPYKCQLCAKSFIRPSSLKTHMFNHTKEKQFACKLCNKKFATLSYMTLHMKRHSSEKPYKCDICGRAAKDPSTIKKHRCLQIQSNVTEDINPIKDKVFATVKQETETFVKNTDSDNTESNTLTLPNQLHTDSHRNTFQTNVTSHLSSHGAEKLTCSLCRKKFSYLRTLKRHMYTHAKEKPYKCQLCAESFIRPSCLKTHMFNHTKEKQFACKLCNKKFATLSYMTLHMKRHSSEKPYKCDICGHAAKHPSTIKKHRCLQIQNDVTADIKPVLDKNIEKAETENISSNKEPHLGISLTNLSNHLCHMEGVFDDCKQKAVDGTKSADNKFMDGNMRTSKLGVENTFKCHLCDKFFSEISFLDTHMSEHSGDTQYMCHFCKRRFLTTDDLKNHIKSHDEKKYLKCAICKNQILHTNFKEHQCTEGEIYSCAEEIVTIKREEITETSLEDIDTETKDGAPTSLSRLACPFCHQDILCEDFDDHFKRFHFTEPMECSLCNKTFGQFSEIAQHICVKKVHVPVFKKSLDKYEPLKQYKFSHGVNRLFMCQLCGKLFIRAAHLKLHMNTHTSEKPFSCELCVKQFLIRSSMKTRMRLHRDRNAHKCDLCHAEFSTAEHLRKHKIAHCQDDNDLFYCDLCGTVVKSFNELEEHIYNHIGD